MAEGMTEHGEEFIVKYGRDSVGVTYGRGYERNCHGEQEEE